MARSIFKTLLLIHLAILTISTIISANNHQYKRHIEANNHRLNTQSTYETSKSTIINSNNDDDNDNDDIALKRGRKISYGLMGGHIKVEAIKENDNDRDVEEDDDEEEDRAKWDDGLFLSSAGNGQEKQSRRGNSNSNKNNNKNDNNNNDDDEKKTLAQQVKEGKYGLIQNEIYSNRPKRPGIISYLSNPDVPKDNAKNLGGLDKEDIWLAENHMLVLRGGKFPDHNEQEEPSGDLQGWSPIDNYQAPKRQVRIPLQPKVPPPFPIQLTDNGPIKIIGNTNDTSTDNGSQWIPEGLIPFNDTLLAESSTENNTSSDGENSNGRRTKSGLTLGGIVGPFFPALPPGAVFVAPPSNQTDYDEDDQSIYYPPPYSFKYSQDNSTAVPPGPLVPGIILPPPPDFFSQLEEKKTTIKYRNNKCPRCTTTTSTSKTSYYNPQKSSTKSYKVYSSTVPSTKLPHRPFTMKPINKLKHKTVTAPLTESVTKSSYIDVTTPSTNRVNTLEISEINTIQPILSNNHVVESQTEGKGSQWRTIGTDKSKPIVAYYPTSSTTTTTTTTPVPARIHEQTIEATPASVKNIIPTEKRPGSLASYYFYEEANDETSGTTANPTVYFQETTQSPPYYRGEDYTNQQRQTTKRKLYYNIEIAPSQQTAQDYSVDIIEPIVKTSPKYRFGNLSQSSKNAGTDRAQGQRMLSNTSPIYYEDVTQRPNPSLRTFFTTSIPKTFASDIHNNDKYNDENKSKPVYQYSFEATNYPNQHDRQPPIYKSDVRVEQEQQQAQKQVPFNEWQEIEDENDGQQVYDYNSAIELPERYNHEITNYRDENLPVNYPTSTFRSTIVSTTPNPAHAYYTKQDEQLLDDVTKEYFTNFGKKIQNQRYQSTTPIYGKSGNSQPEKKSYPTRNSFVTDNYEGRQTATYKAPRVKVHYGDQSQTTYSLDDDTRVNYQQPLPTINTDAEYLPGYGPKSNDPIVQHQTESLTHYPYRQPNIPDRQRLEPLISYDGEQIGQQHNNAPTSFVPLTDNTQLDNNQRIYPASRQPPVSLAGDIDVNYRHPRPHINPDAEFIDAVTGQAENSGNPNSYFAYRLPGDGGHVYFLTPHAINQRQDGNIGGRYLNSQQRGSRPIRRRRRGPRSS